MAENFVVTEYVAGSGTVAFMGGWHEAKAFAQANEHNFIMCGTVIVSNGETVSAGSRCSERYVYYVRVHDLMIGPYEKLSSATSVVKGVSAYEIIRGYEFFFEYRTPWPDMLD